ncbi:hypothetical protein EVA_17924, partial [gut metagenome]
MLEIFGSGVEPILLLGVYTLTSAEAGGNPEILGTPLCRGLGASGNC